MTVNILQFDNYIYSIKKSIGSTLFQTVWAEVDGEKKDILNNGQYSCAIFLSSILLWFGLIKDRHATTAGLLKDMEKSGWYKIDELKPGCILYWEFMFKNGENNDHIGFYIGGEKAISNERDVSTPIEHHYTYGVKGGKPVRKIEAIYWHPRLDNKYFH